LESQRDELNAGGRRTQSGLRRGNVARRGPTPPPQFAASDDEFAIVLNGKVRVDLVKLADPDKLVAPDKQGTVRIPGKPVGKKMGHVKAPRGHQVLLPKGAAQRAGFFTRELVAITIERGRGERLQIEADEPPRADSTLEGLAKLKPIVKSDGTVTAGNASPVNDGASALLLATQSAARRFGLVPRARIIATTTAGVAPRIMGIGPAPAIRKLLEKSGVPMSQIDAIELNEAFAAQALAVMRDLGLADDDARVNPNGGAIAIRPTPTLIKIPKRW